LEFKPQISWGLTLHQCFMLLSQQGLVTAGTYKLTESVTVTPEKISAVWKFWRVQSFTLTHICVLKLTQYSFTKISVETICNIPIGVTVNIYQHLQLHTPQKSVLCVIVNVGRYYNNSGYIYNLSSHAVLWWIEFFCHHFQIEDYCEGGVES